MVRDVEAVLDGTVCMVRKYEGNDGHLLTNQASSLSSELALPSSSDRDVHQSYSRARDG